MFKESNFSEAIRLYKEAIAECPEQESEDLSACYHNMAACLDHMVRPPQSLHLYPFALGLLRARPRPKGLAHAVATTIVWSIVGTAVGASGGVVRQSHCSEAEIS